MRTRTSSGTRERDGITVSSGHCAKKRRSELERGLVVVAVSAARPVQAHPRNRPPCQPHAVVSGAFDTILATTCERLSSVRRDEK